ncbi:MAG: VWA-like domain-containing protein [Fusicatenibacter sp.]|nr:VWA-like domain-containing protein [Fusicatenibacter sp.]
MIQPILEQQERELALIDVGREILSGARNELYLNMRFLDVALFGLPFVMDPAVRPLGTDGANLYFHPEALGRLYRSGRVRVNHAYLHSLLHCLFCHPFPDQKPEEEYWNLACDITAEYILDGLYLPCVHLAASPLRREYFQKLRMEKKVITAQRMYRRLMEEKPDPVLFARLSAEFCVDDHRFWDWDQKKPQSQMQKKHWEEIRERMQTEMETFSKEAASNAESLEEQIRAENRKRYDYREFLRKFSVLKEEMQVDPDSFDYIYYQYGMELYGNMPLIEPLETKEVKKVEDFVIVIDTSMSCKGELVRQFLGQTYEVLGESESFHRKINVHIVQCDEKVQEDAVIRNQKEMQEYLEHFTVKGLGGTDFRPAFEYVGKLVGMGEFTKLRGMIYFTDGKGIYPARKPVYETAFVFLKEDYTDIDVPPWAMKLILEPEDVLASGREEKHTGL